NTIALTAEYMPERFRASAVMTMFCGFSIGAAVVGWVAAALIPRFGWPSVFVVGGILPCVITLFTIAFLPESIPFLLRTPGREKTVARQVLRIAPGAQLASCVQFAQESSGGGFVVKRLFQSRRHWMTLLLWGVFFLNLLDIYFVNSWLPTVFGDVGIPQKSAI